MMKRTLIVAALMSAAGCRPLAPGETRCTTSNVYGTAVTNCKTGQAAPPPAYEPPPVQYQAVPQQVGWSCTDTTREPTLSTCFPQYGECLRYRDEMLRRGETQSPCFGVTRVDCYDKRNANTGHTFPMCAATWSSCEYSRNLSIKFAANDLPWQVASACTAR